MRDYADSGSNVYDAKTLIAIAGLNPAPETSYYYDVLITRVPHGPSFSVQVRVTVDNSLDAVFLGEGV
jgi:hypothetical protein